jgi:hypothetical protein
LAFWGRRDRDGLSKESQDTSLYGKAKHNVVPPGAAAMPMKDWFLLGACCGQTLTLL